MTNLVGTSASSTVDAVNGTNSAVGGEGVHGVNSSNSGYGVVGEGGSVGVLGMNAIVGGSGVQGFTYNTNGYGVYGDASNGGAAGIYGYGGVTAIKALTSHNSGSGVSASATGTYSTGVSASATGTGSFGMYALGSSVGIQAVASGYGSIGAYCTASGTSSVAVQAFGDTSGLSGFFYSNVQILGYLTKSGGGYRIDHPQDPDNKYLNHHFVESNEMKNVYDGTVVLDFSGTAVVSMPSYFEAANSDYRYQLTAIGSAAPNLHVATKIANGSFIIAGGQANQEVSWCVTGVRADKWALQNNPGVEIEKSDEEKGHYMNPELFGFGRDRIAHPGVRASIIRDAEKAKHDADKAALEEKK